MIQEEWAFLNKKNIQEEWAEDEIEGYPRERHIRVDILQEIAATLAEKIGNS